MSKIVIIADDLTGANATSVLLAKQGFKSATFTNLNKYNPENNRDLDVISISTDSRAVGEVEAFNRVKRVVEFFQNEDIKFFCKRVDSTLRGNIGAEIDGVLSELPNYTIAVVVAAFPSSGRVCIGDYLMVNQLPLERTDVAKDPKTPVYHSKVTDIIKNQTQERVGHIELARVLKGYRVIKDELMEQVQAGNRIVVIDAVTDEDIGEIAKAVKESRLKVIAVDPGPFTAALGRELFDGDKGNTNRKVMCVIGSVTNLTRRQAEELRRVYDTNFIEVDTEKLLYDSSRQEEMDRVVELLTTAMDSHNIIGLTTTNGEKDILNLKKIAHELNITEDEISQIIAMSIGKITRRVLDLSGSNIGGLFTTGGDITVSVCNEIGAVGIEVLDEVLPLAVYGKIKDGRYKDISIVTKGGLIGDQKAMIKCVDYLLTKLSN